MNAKNEPEMIVSSTGEITELEKPADFGQGLAFLNPSEMPDLETAEVGMSIQPEYIEFNVAGESIRAVFNGIGHITTKDQKNAGQYKQLPAVVLQTKDGVKLNAGASLVNQFANILPGTAVMVTYKGKEKTKGGNEVKTYDVRLLNVARANVPVQPVKVAPQIEKPKFVNQQMASEYWTLVYSPAFKFTEQDGLDHLAACGNDFKIAIAALQPDNTNPFI